MTDLTIADLTAAARAYEARLVPAIFDSWTDALCDAARIEAGGRVLDVACGTGVLARRAAGRTGTPETVVGLDINPGMLAVAGDRAPSIRWQQGQAEALDFADASFDAVVSQFGLMFFTDRVAALREMARVLAPGGRLAVAVFDDLERNYVYGAIADVFAHHAGSGVGDALRSPFCLGDTGELSRLFADTGLNDIAIRTESRDEVFKSARELVLSDVEGWFPLAGFVLDAETVDAVVGDIESELSDHMAATGEVRFPVAAHIVSMPAA